MSYLQQILKSFLNTYLDEAETFVKIKSYLDKYKAEKHVKNINAQSLMRSTHKDDFRDILKCNHISDVYRFCYGMLAFDFDLFVCMLHYNFVWDKRGNIIK